MINWYRTLLGILIIALAWFEVSKWVFVIIGIILIGTGLIGKGFYNPCICEEPKKVKKK